jgi:phosphohistidine phosphatase
VKILLVLRHAKAQHDAPAGDWPRNLTDRGRRDARTMGEFIRDNPGRPDAIVSSDANRARQTAEIAAEAIGFDATLTLDHAIYDAGLTDLIEVVRSLPADAATVLLVGHNPGLESLAAALAGVDADTLRLPTAGLAHLEFAADRWTEIGPGSGRLVALHTPKEFRS